MKKIITLLLVLSSLFSFSQSTTLVISQLNGGGGNGGAIYNADYVELHNVSSSAISLSGMSIQYSSAANTGNWTGIFALPAASIPAGGYYLIQMSGTGAVGAALPTPDVVASPTISMSATAGKVALVNGVTALVGCAVTAIDWVGYGVTANCSEGGVNAPAPSATLSDIRGTIAVPTGCIDTDNNGADFITGAPAPRNSASPVVLCAGGPPTPSLTVTGTISDFGNIVVGTNSASQSFNLSGANLTGAPGVITITAPSTDFQVSNNNTTWGASTTIAYATATLASTPVYVRFTPQSLGFKSGNITISGGGVTTALTIAVSGTGVATPSPTLTATALTAFGNICVNTTAGPNSFTLTGTNLTTANVTVNALNGFSYSTTSGGTYTSTLSLTQPGGSYSQIIYVMFNPIAVQSYNGNIGFSGGGVITTANVAASGAGVSGAPALTTGSATAITSTSATCAGTISSAGCSAITAYGIEFSLSNTFPAGSVTVVPSTNLAGGSFTANLAGLAPSTTYYYRAYATNAGGTGRGTVRSFTTLTPVLSGTSLAAFPTVCLNTTTAPNSFTLTGTNLTTTDVVIGPKDGYTFSTTSGGTFTSTLTLTQPGGPFSQVVYVEFTPTTVGSYNGLIPVSGGGANNTFVAASGAGVNTAASVTTLSNTVLTPYTVTANGSVTDIGCSTVTEAGIEYSSIRNFTGGFGTRVRSTDFAGTDFTANLTGLIQNTEYFYRAYAVNSGGIAYGDIASFITMAIPLPFTIYSTPIIRGGNVHYTITAASDGTTMKPGHYSAKVFNSIGQQVYQKDLILQVNFIDDNFIMPGQLSPGLYILQIENDQFKEKKSFLVN